ncbi:MAG: hydrolase [Dehalogenimonas sp.]|uniref:Hydrolase n=1 Tax=Candidatus Dehalogenimonas loeffleri TaxID=3127115 RepID=A0ABZ2J683_9CHLR|nr:hydrolase [Dehalogenimonas sp.]
MLTADNALLLIIDVQVKLFRVMPDKEELLKKIGNLIQGCALLGVPAIITEQNTAGLGPTIPEIASLTPETATIEKFTFSCCAENGFLETLRNTGRRQIIICGIESHICVYQTALELQKAGYEVQIVTDGVASRSPANRKLALTRLQNEGIRLTGVEMALFEMLKTARSEQFKAVSTLIK